MCTMGKCIVFFIAVLVLSLIEPCLGFVVSRDQYLPMALAAGLSENDDTDRGIFRIKESPASEVSRRDICRSMVGTAVTFSSGLVTGVSPALAKKEDANGFTPAIRPTAYRVDSTIPPTLLPLTSAQKEKRTLSALGRGSGTKKEEIKIDTLNLNNFMNKAVFGSVDFVAELFSETKVETKSGPGYASFVCMGLPSSTTTKDVDLASSLLSFLLQDRDNKLDTALGLSFCPISLQPALNAYSKSGTESALSTAMIGAGLSREMVDLYMPLIRSARSKSMEFLALAPEFEDIKAARAKGLAAVDFDRRQTYVLDPEGFIGLTKDPRYKLYTDRSLLKDYLPINEDDDVRGFFAEKIFVHETAASIVANYAVNKPESLVTILAPTPDVRYLQGINGRIPRVYGSLVDRNNENGTNSPSVTSKVSDDAVTTILLNPTAAETLSTNRKLRLEIGTGPETLQYQTKIADYLWFSSSPRVSLIPRMMNG